MAEKVLTNLFSVFIIIAVPLFVFTAKVMNTSKVSDMIFTFAHSMVGKVRGGLGHVNVIASLIFSGMTGSAVADASGLGLLEVTQMRKRGLRCRVFVRDHRHFRDDWAGLPAQYPDDLLCHALRRLHRRALYGRHGAGSADVGGAHGPTFPTSPTSASIQWATLSSCSKFLKATFKALPALLTPVILLGGIYSGIVTPTEAGALAAILRNRHRVFVYRSMGVSQLWEVIVDTAKTTGVLSLIVGSAFTFSFIVAKEQIPQVVGSLLLDFTNNKYVLLLIINIVFLVLGMFIDTRRSCWSSSRWCCRWSRRWAST